MVKEHWVKTYFKEGICSLTAITGSRQHQTDLVRLSDQSQWICKLLRLETWLGRRTDAELELTERLAAEVALKLGLSFAAYQDEEGCFLLTPEPKKRGVLIPYCEGWLSDEFSERQAQILGARLAQLHSLNPPLAGGTPFPAIVLPQRQEVPAWVEQLISESNAYRHYRSEEWLFSHRDIHSGNIIWRTEEQPHLIDWESAGLIHPAIELIGLASNCAGLVHCCFVSQNFRATLAGYYQEAGKLPPLDAKIWRLSLHSWLLWYTYCLSQGFQYEAELTLAILDLIGAKMVEMQQIYTELQFSNEGNK